MQHYFAVLEPAASGALHITFPGLDGVGSFAERHTDIVQQASDALESALMVGRGLPLSIEEGARVPLNLAGYDNPLVVVIPFAAPTPKATGHAPARRRTRSRRVERSTRPGAATQAVQSGDMKLPMVLWRSLAWQQGNLRGKWRALAHLIAERAACDPSLLAAPIRKKRAGSVRQHLSGPGHASRRTRSDG